MSGEIATTVRDRTRAAAALAARARDTTAASNLHLDLAARARDTTAAGPIAPNRHDSYGGGLDIWAARREGIRRQ
jgi:hypothetical protein